MSEIKTNYSYANPPMSYNIQGATVELSKRQMSVQKMYMQEIRKNHGLIERLYNNIKNITGLGIGTKKLQKYVDKYENGQMTKEEIVKSFGDYAKSQENSAQLLGDAASISCAGLTYFGLLRLLKMESAKLLLKPSLKELTGDITEGVKRNKSFFEKITDSIVNIAKSNKKLTAVAAITAAFAGGYTKFLTLAVNRIGSKEFSSDKKEFKGAKTGSMKALYKQDKKLRNKERFKSNLRNFESGAINGLMMPFSVLGAAIGVPLYFVGNSLNRYFVGSKENKNKSVGNYFKNITDDVPAQALTVGLLAVPFVKKTNYMKFFDKNLKSATEKLKDVTLRTSEFTGNTTYKELENMLMNSNSVSEIVHNPKISMDDKIKKLTNENIFAVKFKQISNDGSPLANALRENCPATRTLKEAQKFVDTALNNEYQLTKCLGVGTVAETYLAKSKTGEDVCLKVLKNGIDDKKILADKIKFQDIIKSLDKPQEEKEYLLKNLDDLANGILKEVDFNNEMKAATELEKHTKVAKVVKPIEVKNGIYVMEKAEGISLSSLVELNSARNYKEALEKYPQYSDMFKPQENTKIYNLLKDVKSNDEKIKKLENYINEVEARTPQYDDITINKEEMKTLIAEYQQVLVEQFNKVEKSGKVLHADIHPGNIFIDVKALKERKENIIDKARAQFGDRKSSKIFTLIDTGNTVNMDMEQSLRAINLTSYIKKANVPDLAEYVLDGANLGGKTKEEAIKLVSEDLKKCFFDTQTALEPVTNESLITIASNIMRKHGITPSDTQLNLNKARQSANNSLRELAHSLGYIYMKDLKDIKGNMDVMGWLGKIGKDIALIEHKHHNMQAHQEKLNLLQLSLEQQLKQKSNPNNLKTNSEDYLIYKLKQSMHNRDL